ncbi:hypothetical protein ACJIZ3_004267 [Penstemon smallii]|uniref:Long-chain-alcohol oxidase n=1 Tax=Penstemon smallii TaxID=265156 RepID=A0ABD3S1Q9_9LAMI
MWRKSYTFSSGELEVIRAISDTFLPSINVSVDDNNNYEDSVVQFYGTSASMAGTPHRVAEYLGGKIQHPKIPLSRVAVWLLSTWMGTFILCGTKSLSTHFPYFQRFSQIPPHKREQILHSWSNSYFFLLKIFFNALKIFTLIQFFTQVNEKDENISWKAIGYTGPDPDQKARKLRTKITQQSGPKESKEDLYGPLYKGIINLKNQPREIALDKLQNLGFPVSIPQSRNARIKSFNPSFILKCDAVVIGSGSGGGVVAGVLAKAGYKVVVLEKGSYLARNNLSLLEGEAMDQMYLGHGILGTNNMNILVLAGSTVGGGSTINWSASIPTPQNVINEWSEGYKLELFSSKDYQKALQVVCEKMGVQKEFEREGFNNEIMRKGCENLGYHVENIPRNASSDHFCGWCGLGCKDGKKKGTSETWLVDLVESGNGAILPECEAIKVITTKNKNRKKAIGIVFEFQHQGQKETAIIESKVTVTACGAMRTPEVLKRSGLKNPNIGRNLHLHPVVMAWGYFPDSDTWPESEKKSYQGGIMTAMSKVVANSETLGYGAIIQTPSLHPGMFSALMPWVSGKDIKNRMLKYSRTAHVFALARDKGSGSIASPNPNDISYKLESCDAENLSKGIEKVLRILAAAGAEEIGTHHKQGRVLKVKQAGTDEFDKFVKEESLRPFKNQLSSPICSAHQMGSCRMGVDPEVSAVSPKGETWEVEGLFVADSSVFPTALGVNPMVTIQAIAYCTAHSLLEVLATK